MGSLSERMLVLGATGPAGLCLLRELIFRKIPTTVYARSPNKIPKEITTNALIRGEMSNTDRLADAMKSCAAVLSLLGPSIEHKNIESSIYADIYKNYVFPAMRKSGIRRIIAMGTISISHPDDNFVIFALVVRAFMRLFANAIYSNMHNLLTAFQNEGSDLDWTIFRIAMLTGGTDMSLWEAERSPKAFAGAVGAKGWTKGVSRAVLSKWIVDNIRELEPASTGC